MRNLAITAAIAALSFGATATASPFSLTTSSGGDSADKKSESGSVIETVLDSTAGAFQFFFTSGDKHEDDLVLRYKKKQGCEAEETAETEAEPATEEKKALVGPEPIYFGF